MTSVNGCAVVYLSWGVHPKAMEKANNFFNSYKAHPAGYDHELIVIMKGWEAGSNLNSVLEAAGKFSARIIYLQENRGQDGLDLGAYFRVSEIIDHEWVCFLSTYSHILHDNWLKILMEAVIKPNIGAISCSGNWGTSKIHTPVPNPHIRTNAFILRRKLWLNFIMTQGFPVNKLDTYKLEHGRNGLSRFIEQQGLQIAVTGKDKILYYKDQFPDSKTFAHPGLSNLLVGDNMSDAYLNFSSAQKRAFELNAWYKSFTPVINDNYIFVKFIYRNIYKLYALYGRWRFRFRRLPAVAGRCGGWFRCARRAASLLFFSGYLGLRQAWRQKASEGESGLPADPPEDSLVLAQANISAFGFKPLFSILLPVDNVEPHLLRESLESLTAQIYPHWELGVALGEFCQSENRRLLEALAEREPRLKLATQNRAGRASPNAALAQASGDYCGLMHPADKLPAGALYEFAQALNQGRRWDMLYGDENQIDMSGNIGYNTLLKPNWSPETLEGYWYTANFTCYRLELVRELGGYREEFRDSAGYDLALRFTERTRAIKHLRAILYHWRILPGSNRLAYTPRDNSYPEALAALLERARRQGGGGEAGFTPAPGCYDLRYPVNGRPLVSILIATAGRSRNFSGRQVNMIENIVRQLHELTAWRPFEIIVAHNENLSSETLALLESCGCRLIGCQGEFNYSKKINSAAREAQGEYLLLMNDDLEIIRADWLENMLQLAQRQGVGAVGAKLWLPDGLIQHIGVFFCPQSVYKHFDYMPAHIHHTCPPEQASPPQLYSNQNYLAVTGAVLMTPRAVFQALGGFAEQIKVNFNDVDYCLRVVQSGRRVVWAAQAELYHYESSSRDKCLIDDREFGLFWATWRKFISEALEID